jgi:hypothetical protein
MERLFKVRRSRPSDLEALMMFYRRNQSQRLPTPLIDQLHPAARDGMVYLVEDMSFDQGAGRIVAAGAIFETVNQPAPHVVLEFGAMREMGAVGGLEPMTTQDLLLQLRMLFVATNFRPMTPGSALTVHCYVYGGTLDGEEGANDRSLAALERAGFKRLERTPDWLEYDLMGWSDPKEKWIVMFASEQSGSYLVESFRNWEWETDRLILRRKSREADQAIEVFSFTFEDLDVLRTHISRLLEGHPDYLPLPWSSHPAKL